MTLFYSFTQFNSILLFVYLGLICGIIFETLKNILNTISFAFFKRKVIHNSTNKISKKKNKFKNFLIKNKSYFIVFLNKFLTTSTYILLLFSLIIEVSVCFFINLEYNFGIITIFCVFLWIVMFYVGKGITKTVAKFAINFYNYLNKKVKHKNG